MPRRKDHSPEELQRNILDAAESLIVEMGLEAVTARNIATKVGYTPGTLYNHFADRDEIIMRVNVRTLNRLVAHLNTLPLDPDDPQQSLVRISKAYVSFAVSKEALWSVLTGFRRSENAPPPAWYVEALKAPLVRLSQAFVLLDPGLSPQEQDYRIRRLWASIHGLCMIATAGSIAQSLVTPLDRMVEDLVRMQLQA